MPDFVNQAMRMIGAIPAGDPAELEAYARRLEMAAEIFDTTNTRLVSTVESAGLHQGPFADRFKARSQQFAESSRRHSALECRRLAVDVRTQASRLRSQQNDWRTNLRRVAARLESDFQEKLKN